MSTKSEVPPPELPGTNRFVQSETLFSDRTSLLADASKCLLESMDYESTLHQIADIALKGVSDWCIVDVIQDNGTFKRVTVKHRDLSKNDLCEELKTSFSPTFTTRGVPSQVLRTRQPVLIQDVTDEHYRATAQSSRHEYLLRSLGSHSYLSVPFIAREHFLGAMTFVSSMPNRRYDKADLHFAEELCARAALAIDNARLYREAQKAVRMRDDLINMVSHDLKSPLSIVKMATQMLDSLLPPQARDGEVSKILEMMNRATSGMTALITDLLDVAKIENDAFALQFKHHPISCVCREVIEDLLPLALEKQVALNLDISEDFMVECDLKRLHQALSNLVANAIKFNQIGGHVYLSATRSDKGIHIVLVDSGCGIEPHEIEKIFDKFWHVGRKNQAGTGLGLSIAKSIIEAHSGKISVESELGHGSKFTVILPLRQQIALQESHETPKFFDTN